MIKQLLRTNPLLTTNYKLVVTTDYFMYLESFDTNYTLSNIKYKHFLVPTNSWLSERLSSFYKNLSKDVAFDIKQTNNIFEKYYKNQYDDIYWAGCKNIEDLYYKENKEYTAPILLDGTELPEYFLIYRVNTNPITQELTDYTNFFNDKVKNMSLVYSYDLTENTNLGFFLKRNITDNNNFPKDSININVNKNEFTKWNGINYENGGFVSKSLFSDEIFNADSIHSDTEDYLTKGFKNTGTICCNILNLKFLFNDYQTKLTNNNSFEKIDFSLNQYLGFYSKKRYKIKTFSPYNIDDFNKNFYVVNNVFKKNIDDDFSTNPLNKNWPNKKIFFKIGDSFKEVVYSNNEYKIIDNALNNFKISDINIEPSIVIETIKTYFDDNSSKLSFYLKFNNNTTIQSYESIDNDFLTIEINNKMYTCTPDIYKINDEIFIKGYFIYTDDYIISNSSLTSINDTNTDIIINDNLVNNYPILFNLYYHDMVEIHDLDFNYLNTDYAKTEYESIDKISVNNQPKLQTDLDFNRKYNININNTDIAINDNTIIDNTVNIYNNFTNGTFETIDDSTLKSSIIVRNNEILDEDKLNFTISNNPAYSFTGAKSMKIVTSGPYNTRRILLPMTSLVANNSYKFSINLKLGQSVGAEYYAPNSINFFYYGFDDASVIDNTKNILWLDGVDNSTWYNLNFKLNIKNNTTGYLQITINYEYNYSSYNIPYPLYFDNLEVYNITNVSNNLVLKDLSIPYSSEYSLGKDLYLNNNISTVWAQNSWLTKWGASNSIGHSDYPYKFNLSSKVSGFNNLEPSLEDTKPNVKYCNLDWFYVLGEPKIEDYVNSFPINNPNRYKSYNYLYYSLNLSVKNNSNMFWTNQYFDFTSHLNTNYYFDQIFNNDFVNDTQNKKSVNKYSIFKKYDDNNAPYTIFKGLKYNLWTKKNNILNYKIDITDLKFSILLSKRTTNDSSLFGKCGGTFSINVNDKTSVLVFWFYCPENSLTSIENCYRYNLYKGTVIYNDNTQNIIDNYCYDIDKIVASSSLIHSGIKLSNLTPNHLTLYNIYNYINGNLAGFDYPIEYLSNDNNSYFLTVQKPDKFIVDNLSYKIDENNISLIDVNNKLGDTNTVINNDDNNGIINTPYFNQSKNYEYKKINRTYSEIYDFNTSVYLERFSTGYLPITKKIDVFSNDNIILNTKKYNQTNSYITITNINTDNTKGYLTLVIANTLYNLKKNMFINIDCVTDYTYTDTVLDYNMNIKPIWGNNKYYKVIDFIIDKVNNTTSIMFDYVDIIKINSNLTNHTITTIPNTLSNTYVIDLNNNIFNIYYLNGTNYNRIISNNKYLHKTIGSLNSYPFNCNIFSNVSNSKFWCNRYDNINSINVIGSKNFGNNSILCNRIVDNFFPKSLTLNIEPNIPIIDEIKLDYTDFNIFSSNFEIGFYKKTINNNFIK